MAPTTAPSTVTDAELTRVTTARTGSSCWLRDRAAHRTVEI
jgi:hypothetical protein